MFYGILYFENLSYFFLIYKNLTFFIHIDFLCRPGVCVRLLCGAGLPPVLLQAREPAPGQGEPNQAAAGDAH